MTRKDFRALALALAAHRPDVNDFPVDFHPRVSMWLAVVHEIKKVCADSNPRLNADVFISWCMEK